MSYVHTLVLGDTHMEWNSMLRALHHFHPQVCIVAGDFGWWPTAWVKAKIHGQKQIPLDYLLESKPNETEIRFIEGNHEDLPRLFGIAEHYRRERDLGQYEAVELRDGLWYQPRGSTYTLADGRTILFCGGGKSVDAPLRKLGVNWFKEEIVCAEQLPKTLPKADIVISHTVPNRLNVLETIPAVDWEYNGWDSTPDPTCTVLDWIFDTVHPDLWIASHLHLFRKGKVDNTEYFVLDRTDNGECPLEEFSYVLIS